MKTSQLAIVGIMIIILGGMVVLYLRDQDKLNAYQSGALVVQNGTVGISAENEIERKRVENEVLSYKVRIAELEREVAELKSNAVLAPGAGDSSGAPELPVEFTLTGKDDKNNAALTALQQENERLKQQNKLAMEESGLVVDAGIQKKEEEARLAEHIVGARAMGKVDSVDVGHYILIISPIGQPNFNTREGEKQELIVRREGKLLIKTVVDSLDAETGKYISYVEPTASKADVELVKKGDEIILAPASPKKAPTGRAIGESELPSLPAVFDVPTSSGKSSGKSAKGNDSAPALPDPIK